MGPYLTLRTFVDCWNDPFLKYLCTTRFESCSQKIKTLARLISCCSGCMLLIIFPLICSVLVASNFKCWEDVVAKADDDAALLLRSLLYVWMLLFVLKSKFLAPFLSLLCIEFLYVYYFLKLPSLYKYIAGFFLSSGVLSWAVLFFGPFCKYTIIAAIAIVLWWYFVFILDKHLIELFAYYVAEVTVMFTPCRQTVVSFWCQYCCCRYRRSDF